MATVLLEGQNFINQSSSFLLQLFLQNVSPILSEEEQESSILVNEKEKLPLSTDELDSTEALLPSPSPSETSSSSSVNSLLHLRRYERRLPLEGGEGELLVRALCAQDLEGTVDLLTDSFAELFGLTFRPLLRLQVKLYLQQRLLLLPHAVTLIALYYPPEGTDISVGTDIGDSTKNSESVGGRKRPEVVATVELSFSDAAQPSFPTLNPPKGSAYLCNMAVLHSCRRRGVGRVLLQAAEDLTVEMGHKALYLHCRLCDIVPQKLYRRAGFQEVATDNFLSLVLFLQRRRHLMRKMLHGDTTVLREDSPGVF